VAKDKSKKLIYIGIFVVGVILLLVPLITKNHIYQGVALGGDTMKFFIPMINSASDGNSMLSLSQYGGYLGLWIAMWVLGAMNKVIHINPQILFYLYSICVLMGASITLYYLGKFVAGVRGGWIVMVMVMLCCTSILTLYSVACTINIINIYIVLPWTIILLAKWFRQHNWHWLVFSLISLAVFVVLHPTGAYLPLAIIVLIIGLGMWRMFTKRLLPWRYIWIAIAVLVGSLCATWHNIIGISSIANSFVDTYSFYLLKALRFYFVPVPTIIGILTAVAWWKHRKNISFDMMTKIVLVAFGCLEVGLIGVSLLRMTVLSERQVVDAAGILAIMIAIVLGRLIMEKDLYQLKVSSYALMALGGVVTVHGWIN